MFKFFSKKSSTTNNNSSFSLEAPKGDFVKEYVIVGNHYKCQKNKHVQRQVVINRSQIFDAIHLEKFMFRGKPAYLVVSDKLKLDLGTISASGAYTLSQNADASYFGFISQPLDDTYKVVIYKAW